MIETNILNDMLTFHIFINNRYPMSVEYLIINTFCVITILTIIFIFSIDYLLDLLQQTFFNLKLNCRKRRNSIERRSLFNNNKRIQGNKKNPSFSSMLLEPTFERSIMTMSFLMFGVFVIQVVQV